MNVQTVGLRLIVSAFRQFLRQSQLKQHWLALTCLHRLWSYKLNPWCSFSICPCIQELIVACSVSVLIQETSQSPLFRFQFWRGHAMVNYPEFASGRFCLASSCIVWLHCSRLRSIFSLFLWQFHNSKKQIEDCCLQNNVRLSLRRSTYKVTVRF